MAIDYIPRPDGSFDAFQRAFVDYASAHGPALGLSIDDIDGLNGLADAWRADYAAHTAAQAAARAAVTRKDAARSALAAFVRELAARIQTRPATTDADREHLGLTVRDRTPTPVAAPTASPLLRIDASQRLLHIVRHYSPGDPPRAARPRGVMGAEIRVALTAVGAPPPAGPDDYRHVAVASRPPTRVEFKPVDAGKTAHFIARWISTRGAKGPWSDTLSATVGA